ncbi:GEVED domain-containing protein [Flavobacterium tistrianum]|uniref:GEVED domain-containing protein n=1 Tax=Flavobacterium tistrianum TaxID=1685414 RepID=UPI000DAF3453|nr:GEVED domain-containing protein [Flavobacterium tistrianum]KAF2339128.1 T9SS sorting signal type C domain-containing protein [Flavobacterium tistrianum]
MMRKLLYSFLFFISYKSLFKRSFTPSLGLLCVGMFFVALQMTFSQNRTSNATGNWSAAGTWVNASINRTGTITSSTTSNTVTGVSTLFLTQLSIGSVITTQGGAAIGTVASIASNTSLTLTANASSNNTTQTYRTTGGPPSPVDNVSIVSNHNVTVNGTFTCASLFISPVNNNTSTLSYSGSTSQLTVNGIVTLGESGANNRRGALNMTNGGLLICQGFDLANSSGSNTFTSGSGTVQLTATNTLPSTIFTTFNNLTVSSGTTTLGTGLTVNGNLSITGGGLASGNNNLTITGNFTNAGTFTPGTATVTLNGNNNNQSFNVSNFYNLTLAGTGAKSFTNATTIANSLVINSGASANLGTQNHTAASLTYGTTTAPTASSWGSSASLATNKNTTYFGSSATGILNVTCAYFTSVNPITEVILNTLDKTSSNLTTSPAYEDFTSDTPTTLVKDQFYVLTVKGNTTGYTNGYYTAYFDWNNNGVFTDSNESYTIGTINNSTGADGAITSVYLQIPSTAVAGNIKMRIVARMGGYSGGPCVASGSAGQIEEYTVTLLNSCSGNPTSSTTVSSSSSVCPSSPFTLSLGSTFVDGSNYVWQKSTDGTNWTNATPTSTNYFYSNFSTPQAANTTSGDISLAGGDCIINGTELILTDTSLSGHNSGFFISKPTNSNINAFTATFKYRIWGTTTGGAGADGMSFSYGSNVVAGAGGGENGEGDGIIIQFDTYDNEGVTSGGRVRVLYNNVRYFTSAINAVALRNASYRDVVLRVDANAKLSLVIAGVTVVSDLFLPGYSAADKSSWKFKFSARTGGENDRHSIDDLSIDFLDTTGSNSTFTTSQTVKTYYRALVTCGSNTTVASTPVMVDVTSATITPMTYSTCTGVAFTVTPANGTNGTIPGSTTYTWTAPTVTGGLTGGAANTVAASSITGTLTNTTLTAQTATYTVTPITGSCSGVPFTLTVTVNPNNTISLSSAANTNAQTVCINTAITDIKYNTTGATGATFSGLPTGVTGSWSGNVVTISGIPTVSQASAYNYTVTLTGGCGTITATGSITVNPTSVGGTISGSISGCAASSGTTFTLTGNVGNVVQWESSTDNFATAGIAIANTTTSLTVSNVNVTTYYRALVKSGSCSSVYSSIGSITTGKVTATAATLTVCNGFTANWNKVPGASTYLLDVSTSNTFSPFVTGFNGKDVGDVSSFAVTGLLPNTTYYYRVYPIYSCGVYAVASNVVSVTTAALPTVAAIGGGASSVCIGTTTPAFTNSTTGGTWSITNITGNASITSGGVVTGIASGTVTVGYTVTNGSCSSTATKSLTVNPNNTITLSSAAGTDSQTVCANTAISDITYATTGATGATFSGLPAGVTGGWAGNVITISGTPTTEVGSPFNYTVTLISGCGNISATGTITVKQVSSAPSITKNNDVSCGSFGSITLTGLSGNWTINQTGTTTLPRSFSGTSSTLPIQDLVVGTYYFTVTNDVNCTSSSVTVKIDDITSNTTWNGSGWSNGEPDGSKSVTISSVVPSQPFSAAKPNITACSLNINVPNGATDPDVIIPSEMTLTITNGISSNGKLTFESGSSLLQGASAVNTGNISYKRKVSMRRYDVVYWSSPVTRSPIFTLHDLSPNTLWDKYHKFNSTTEKWTLISNGTEEMVKGNGYSIRGPQNFDLVTPQIFEGVFVGVPNNGDVSFNVQPNKFNLIGNPYPSPVDAGELMLENKDKLGSLYFWTHNQPPQFDSGTNSFKYLSSDFVVFNGTGSVRVNNDVVTGADEFKGYIGAGQAFFAIPPGTAIKFKNEFRKGSSENTQFYKTAKTSKIEKNRLWLNIANSQGAFKQILVGYIEGATNGIDVDYDAVTMGSNSYIDFYTLNENQKLTVQGRALPFDNTEVIPLGYRSGVDDKGDRNFTISIDHTDGFFNTQAVYLEDKVTGKVIDLRKENYTFFSAAETNATRFSLRYTNKTLGTGEFENLENTVLVSVKDKTVNITSSKETIKEVNVYNVGAQLLYTNSKVNASELQIKNLHSTDQVLLVKITLENGHTFTKKAIFSNL